jgi:hypothetical protein
MRVQEKRFAEEKYLLLKWEEGSEEFDDYQAALDELKETDAECYPRIIIMKGTIRLTNDA